MRENEFLSGGGRCEYSPYNRKLPLQTPAPSKATGVPYSQHYRCGLSFLDVALQVIGGGLTAINSTGFGESYALGFHESVIIIMNFRLWISVTKLLARVPVSISAAVLATMIKKAAVPRTLTAESAVHSPPHNSGP